MDIDENDLEQLFHMCHGLLREASPLRIDVDHSGTIEISEFIGPLSRLSSRNAFNAMQLSLSLYFYSLSLSVRMSWSSCSSQCSVKLSQSLVQGA